MQTVEKLLRPSEKRTRILTLIAGNIRLSLSFTWRIAATCTCVSAPRLFHLCNYSLLDGHSGKRKMYDTMRNEFYWPHRSNAVYAIVCDCHFCGQNRTYGKRQRQPKLFLPEGPMKQAIDILEFVPRSKESKQFEVMMTDQYVKLTKAATTKQTNATTVARHLLEHWVEKYGTLPEPLTDNGL